MGIKAVLMKNTPEIRERITILGLCCTNDESSFLFYNEKTGCVSWDYRTEYPSDVLNCGENETLFFQILKLKTSISETTEELRADRDYHKDRANYYKSLWSKEREEYSKYQAENECFKMLIDSFKEPLEILQKENTILKNKIQELETSKKNAK